MSNELFNGAEAAAREILTLNPDLPAVLVTPLPGGMVRVDTLGDYVVFRADISRSPEEWEEYDEFFAQFIWAAQQLKSNPRAPIPGVAGTTGGVLVCMDSLLRPDARPYPNGHCTIVFPENRHARR